MSDGGFTPRRANGSIDWLSYLRTTWPIIVTLIGFIWWMSGRLQTPSEKREMIDQALRPIEQQLTRIVQDVGRIDGELASHIKLPSHAVTEAKMQGIKDELQDIKHTLSTRTPWWLEIQDDLQKIKNALPPVEQP